MDELTHFKAWWESTRHINAPVPPRRYGNLSGLTLFRQAPFQVELFLLAPHSVIAPHVHPNVDSYEVYLSGDILFHCDGVQYPNPTIGDCIRVRPDSWHGGTFGERGGAFLSIQHWLNGVAPSSVGEDWKDAAGNSAGTASTQEAK